MAPNSGAVQTSGSGGLANGWWKAYLETRKAAKTEESD